MREKYRLTVHITFVYRVGSIYILIDEQVQPSKLKMLQTV